LAPIAFGVALILNTVSLRLMQANSKIDPIIFQEVQEHLAQIEKEHNVTILQAIESGSRAWGFPSPDSDYDVRFIYAHPKDWYFQLSEERDVIELPISDDLDIAGWDLRKALNLANKGNAIIQEWMISPIVYQQSDSFSQLLGLVGKAFNPTSAYHHYRSMAKKAYSDIEQSEQKKLKRFFYFARATLSAQWIVEHQSMPSIVFSDLIDGLMSDIDMVQEIQTLIYRKSGEPEKSVLEVPESICSVFTNMYGLLQENASFASRSSESISNQDFRHFVSI